MTVTEITIYPSTYQHPVSTILHYSYPYFFFYFYVHYNFPRGKKKKKKKKITNSDKLDQNSVNETSPSSVDDENDDNDRPGEGDKDGGALVLRK